MNVLKINFEALNLNEKKCKTINQKNYLKKYENGWKSYKTWWYWNLRIQISSI